MPRPPKRSAGNTKVYFAFPDRAYHYDCARCDALCCRGHGIGTAAPETPGLVARYPELAWTATKHGRTGSNFTNPSGACFFLATDNLCRVERDHGREAKPGVCVVFPFNNYSRLGDILVVRPHFLCPLELRPGQGAGNHEELAAQLEGTGMAARARHQPGHDYSPEEAEEIVRREEAFRDRCGAAIGRGRFSDLLENLAEPADALPAWRQRALRLWGLPLEAPPRESLDDIMLALAPPLRMRMVRLSERGKRRVLLLAADYLRQVARVSGQPLSLQGAHHMIVNVLGVLRLLARGDLPLRLPPAEVVEGVEFQNPALTLAFFQVLEELQAGRELFGALEAALPGNLGGLERTIFLHQLAARVRELKRSRRSDA